MPLRNLDYQARVLARLDVKEWLVTAGLDETEVAIKTACERTQAPVRDCCNPLHPHRFLSAAR